MMQRTQPIHTWKAFTRAMESDFGPSIYDCPRATLFKLTQTGSVNDYYLEFTSLANRVSGLTHDAIMDCFISGLQADLRREVLAHCPFSLLKAVSLARLFEEKYQPTQKQTPSPTYPRSFSQNRTTTNTNPITNNTPKSQLPPPLTHTKH